MDETEERKETSQSGDSSSGTKGTSTEPEKAYNKESETKAISDALSKAGRTDKELTDKAQKAETLLAEATKIKETAVGEQSRVRKEKDEREMEAAKDQPQVLDQIQKRQKLQVRETELSERELKLKDGEKARQEALDELAGAKREKNALEVAIKHGVPFEKLLKFTDGSIEQMEELAQSLPKQGGQKASLKADSGKTVGAGELNEEEKLKKRYPTM